MKNFKGLARKMVELLQFGVTAVVAAAGGTSIT